jgi:hypothetical protein
VCALLLADMLQPSKTMTAPTRPAPPVEASRGEPQSDWNAARAEGERRRRRDTGRGELPRRQSPSWQAEPNDPRVAPTAAPPRRAHPTRDPLPRRGTQSTGNDPRRERPTWRSEDLPRRRTSGTHRALGENAPQEVSSERIEVAAPRPDERRARLEAEQLYRRGLRHLFAQRFGQACDDLQDAVARAPDALEYQLCALWARHRLTTDPEKMRATLAALAKLAKRAAIQDRSLPFPPYVLAHVALAEGDDERALRLFRVAAYRESANVDAERHVRLLTKRLGLE